MAVFDNYMANDKNTAQANLLKQQSNVKVEGAQNTNQTTNTQTGTNQQSVQNQLQQTMGNTYTDNMDPASMAALQLLIKQLMGGGTQQMAEDQARRQQEIGAAQSQRSAYSKDNAFADAQGAMSQQLRMALEKMVPSLTRAAQGAGTSQNSLRALMMQDVGVRSAESAAALGLNAATQYGGIATNLTSILEKLTQPNDPATTALLQALSIAKGATQNTRTNSTTQGTTVTDTNSTQDSTATQKVQKDPTVTATQFYPQGNDVLSQATNNPAAQNYTPPPAESLLQALTAMGAYGNRWDGVTF